MDLAKSYEFFKPEMMRGQSAQIVGCGSVGSTVAEILARFGISRFVLYDFDTVEPHNIVNQMYTSKHLYRPKTECLAEMLREINPEAEIRTEDKGWTDQPLDGYVFLALDTIELRAKIVKENMYNHAVKAMFDFRTGLTDAQHYAADWSSMKDRNELLKTMKFTHEDAMLNSPVSACNVPLCVAPTVRMIANAGVCNFVNFVKGEKLMKKIQIDAFSFRLDPIP